MLGFQALRSLNESGGEIHCPALRSRLGNLLIWHLAKIVTLQ